MLPWWTHGNLVGLDHHWKGQQRRIASLTLFEACMSPARSSGPALVSGSWTDHKERLFRVFVFLSLSHERAPCECFGSCFLRAMRGSVNQRRGKKIKNQWWIFLLEEEDIRIFSQQQVFFFYSSMIPFYFSFSFSCFPSSLSLFSPSTLL